MGEFISLKVDLDKATVALLKAQKIYESLRRDELAFLGTTGGDEVTSFGRARVAKPEEGSPQSSPDPGKKKDKPGETRWDRMNTRFDKIERFVRRAVASPVETGFELAGAIPEVGGIIKGGWAGAKLASDLGAPALKGVLKALLPDALKEFGIPQEVIDRSLDKALKGISGMQGLANRLRNWDEAFQPTLQTMADVVKLRTRAGGTVNSTNLSKMYDFLFDYNKAETSMRRKMEQMGRERLWEGIAESVKRSLSN
jgi:hypothetical protein